MAIARFCLGISLLLVTFCSTIAQEKPRLQEIDRIRLREAFRLAGQLADRVWPRWSKVPFAVLLITSDQEFLVRHPNPPADFTRIGHDPMLKSVIYSRKRVFEPRLLATFPLNGVPTVAVGRAESTSAATSTPWVAALLHEHFHQLQYSQPGYFKRVAGLGLSRGDESGMWMLNFAFPYSDPKVESSFSELVNALARALDSRGKRDFAQKLSAYTDSRRSFANMLAPDDYKYFAFQVWQEGVARYTEYRIAKMAALQYKPTKEFRQLRDFKPFSQVADSLLGRIDSDLKAPALGNQRRVAFYSVGAAEAMLGDIAKSNWQPRYFIEPFSTEAYLAPN